MSFRFALRHRGDVGRRGPLAVAGAIALAGGLLVSAPSSVSAAEEHDRYEVGQRRSPVPDAVVAEVAAAAVQNNPPWNLDRVDQQRLPLDAKFTTVAAGAGVKVYVEDSGILASHIEFGGRVAAGFDGVYDGNGTTDCFGYGTAVSSVIAGASYGVAKGATLVPVRVFDCSGGGYWASVFAGLEWVKASHLPGEPAVLYLGVVSDSFPEFDDAVRSVVADGVTVVTGSADDGGSACILSPGGVAEVITVGATGTADEMPPWSRQGTCIDLLAPGVDVPTAMIGSNSASTNFSSTFLAAAEVAGAAALLLGVDPTLTPAQVADQLVADATGHVVRDLPMYTPDRLLFVPPGPPPNDDFADATVVDLSTASSDFYMSSPSVIVDSWSRGATSEPGEPDHGTGTGGRSVWWTFTPSVSGQMSVGLDIGSVVAHDIAVYTGGSLGSLVKEFSSTFTASAGTQYRVAVDPSGSASGSVRIRIVPPTPPPPANDNWADAAVFSLADTSPISGSNVSATAETGEPYFYMKSYHSVWWKFVPASDGQARISIQQNQFDDLFLLLTGESVDGLTEVPRWVEENNGEYYSHFSVAAGVTYYLMVDSRNGTGPFKIVFDHLLNLAAPTAPRALAAKPKLASAYLSWTAPLLSPTSRVKDYMIQYRTAGPKTWTTVSRRASTSRTYTVTGLANGTLYEFRVAAVNNDGVGLWSTIVSARPGAPLMVSRPSATAGKQSLKVTWSAPSTNGSTITDYLVAYHEPGGGWTVFPDGVSTARSAVITGLLPGHTYEVMVAAVNAFGAGQYSVPSRPTVVPDVPSKPLNVTGAPKSAAVALAWQAPMSWNGARVTDYLIEFRAVGTPDWTPFPDAVSTARARVVTGLVNGTEYEFRVRARNLAGDGAWSDGIKVFAGAPAAPGKPSVTALAGSARVTWSAPSANGSPVADYVIAWQQVGTSTWTLFPDATSTARTVIVTGLAPGSSYVFRVAAINANGQGPWSAPSTAKKVL